MKTRNRYTISQLLTLSVSHLSNHPIAKSPNLSISQSLILSISLFLFLTLTACGLLPTPEAGTPTLQTAPPSQLTPTKAPSPALSPSRVQSPAGTPAPAVPSLAPSAEVENVSRLREVGQIKVTDPQKVVWSLDGKSLAAVTQTGFSIFNPQTLQSSRSIPVTSPTIFLDLSPDLRVFATTSDQQAVELRDTNGGVLLRTIKPGAQFGDATFSSDGRMVAITSMDEIAVTLWDVQTGQQIKKLSGFQTAAPVYNVTFSADNKTLFWISRGTIQLTDIASGKLGVLFQHEDFIFDQALTPDGHTLITAAEGTVILWDVATGKKTKASPPLNPNSIALSPAGRVLAFGAGNDLVLWDVANQKQLRALTGHTDRVVSMAFSPDGTMLASASDDDTLKLWAAK